MTVTFCGHRKLNHIKTITNLLHIHIENLIKNGADTFFVGCYGEFDELAAKVLKTLKIQYPHIKSINIIPYKNKKMNICLYDYIKYPFIENVHPKYAIIKCNQYMVDNSDVLIAYIQRDTGGAFKTFAYAKKQNKHIILL